MMERWIVRQWIVRQLDSTPPPSKAPKRAEIRCPSVTHYRSPSWVHEGPDLHKVCACQTNVDADRAHRGSVKCAK